MTVVKGYPLTLGEDLIAAYTVGPNQLLGEFLEFTGIPRGSGRIKYMTAIANGKDPDLVYISKPPTEYGIPDFPSDSQQKLLAFAKKKMGGEEVIPARRKFLTKSASVGIALFTGLANDANNNLREQDYDGVTEDATYAALGGLAIYKGKQLAVEYDDRFKKQLKQWLKEKYDIDFVLPPAKGQGAAR